MSRNPLRRWLCQGLMLCLAFSSSAAVGPQAWAQTPSRSVPPQIWFHMGGYQDPEAHRSWDTLFFAEKAPWPEFMNHVQVVELLTQHLLLLSDAELAKVAARLKEHHIALAVAMLSQAYDNDKSPSCGQGVEGYFASYQTANLAAKLKRAGATLQYISMDEPLWFGHYYNGPHACHSSIADVAQRVAANVRAYQSVFPNLIVGESVPIPSLTNEPHWQDDYRAWRSAFKAATGRPIAFAAIDIDWYRPNWTQSLSAITGFVRNEHMQLGIIYNSAATSSAETNEQWLNSAVDKFTAIETRQHVVPDQAIFASWVKFPPRSLTDETGLGEDYLVKRYLQLHAAAK
ncbi:hypothetical protein [uncultured Bradyrhizobium sp.]|uniref:hypothetical protein n=1 Tax=uncultured Bradyrhizobium sp. TaxID=199684 RepID=UPI002606518D|nr:hypothetical protein [uncultured Bradyrhizobium sp.]